MSPWEQVRIAIRDRDSGSLSRVKQALCQKKVPPKTRIAIQAMLDMTEGRFERARKGLLSLSKKRALVPEERIALGLSQIGPDPKGAYQTFRGLIELEKPDCRVFEGLGAALLTTGQILQALPPLKRAAGLDPQSWNAWHLLGTAHLAQGKAREARENFDKALELFPGLPSSLVGFARASLRLNDVGPAIERLAPIVTQSPRHPDLAKALADCYLKQGNTKRASGTLLPAARVSKDPSFLCYFVDVSLSAGRMKAAEAGLMTLRLRKANPDQYKELAERFEALGSPPAKSTKAPTPRAAPKEHRPETASELR